MDKKFITVDIFFRVNEQKYKFLNWNHWAAYAGK